MSGFNITVWCSVYVNFWITVKVQQNQRGLRKFSFGNHAAGESQSSAAFFLLKDPRLWVMLFFLMETTTFDLLTMQHLESNFVDDIICTAQIAALMISDHSACHNWSPSASFLGAIRPPAQKLESDRRTEVCSFELRKCCRQKTQDSMDPPKMKARGTVASMIAPCATSPLGSGALFCLWNSYSARNIGNHRHTLSSSTTWLYNRKRTAAPPASCPFPHILPRRKWWWNPPPGDGWAWRTSEITKTSTLFRVGNASLLPPNSVRNSECIDIHKIYIYISIQELLQRMRFLGFLAISSEVVDQLFPQILASAAFQVRPSLMAMLGACQSHRLIQPKPAEFLAKNVGQCGLICCRFEIFFRAPVWWAICSSKNVLWPYSCCETFESIPCIYRMI